MGKYTIKPKNIFSPVEGNWQGQNNPQTMVVN